jgi:hypothetical protein
VATDDPEINVSRVRNRVGLGGSFFRYWNGKNSFQVHQRYCNFYRYVTKREYYMKLKEKYDQICLDIVLKRLVNEHFEW